MNGGMRMNFTSNTNHLKNLNLNEKTSMNPPLATNTLMAFNHNGRTHADLVWGVDIPTNFDQSPFHLLHQMVIKVWKDTIPTDNLEEINRWCKRIERKTPYILTKASFEGDMLVIELHGIEPLSSSLTLQEVSSAWHRVQHACFETFPIPETEWVVQGTTSVGTMWEFLDRIGKKSLPTKLARWFVHQQVKYDSSPIYQPRG